jgi:hypothetical protein
MAAVGPQSGVRFAAEVTADLAEMAGARDTLAGALRECGWSQDDALRTAEGSAR